MWCPNQPCLKGCKCAKCVDPDAYERWKTENPFDYASWLTTVLDDDEWEAYLESDDCPI